jgi:autotransporter adhesin
MNVGSRNKVTESSASAAGILNTASGNKSSAFGYGTSASGNYSSAFGYNNIASGNYSSAFGYNNTASGNYSSSAIGYNNIASGNYSSAFGYGNTASGYYSYAFGHKNTASGNYSSAFGYGNTASDATSSAFGNTNTASGSKSSAFGYSNTASGATSSAFGNTNTASGSKSSAFGYRSIARIDKTTNICGPIIARKDNDEASGLELHSYCGAEIVLLTKEVDLKVAATQTITIPSGANFFPNECGVHITSADTVTVQPFLTFGITGTNNKLIASIQTTGLTAALKRQRFQTLLSSDGEASLTATVGTGATATTLLGRFYFKGILVEDE